MKARKQVKVQEIYLSTNRIGVDTGDSWKLDGSWDKTRYSRDEWTPGGELSSIRTSATIAVTYYDQIPRRREKYDPDEQGRGRPGNEEKSEGTTPSKKGPSETKRGAVLRRRVLSRQQCLLFKIYICSKKEGRRVQNER